MQFPKTNLNSRKKNSKSLRAKYLHIFSGSDLMVNLQEFALDLRNYFTCCPICFASTKGTFSVHLTAGGKDTLSCNVCGSKWILHIAPFQGFEWAELETPAKDGRGQEFIGKRLDREAILSLAQKGNDSQTINKK